MVRTAMISRYMICSIAVLLLAMSLPVGAVTQLDKVLAGENSKSKLKLVKTGRIDDLAFLRRLTVDLIGRIPSQAEIKAYQAWSPKERRQKLVDKLLQHPRFADRWTVFFADMLRIRTNTSGGSQWLAYVNRSIRNGVPYDVMAREMISANGKANQSPAVGFILGDDADAMALAGATAQVFMGIRISCAQCHDHPFDDWKQREFYNFAAYFGKTTRVQSRFTNSVYTTESNKMSVLWPPERKKPKTRTPVMPKFPFAIDKPMVTPPHVARLRALREAQARAKASVADSGDSIDSLLDSADTSIGKKKKGPGGIDIEGDAIAQRKKLNVTSDLYRPSELREQLSKMITDPYNRYFSQSFVNRVWAQLLGRGIVIPLDDFSEYNTPSHPKTLSYLANEFVATGYDLRALIKMIVTSESYQRSHLPVSADKKVAKASREAFTAANERRMISEVLYDSIVTAGHLSRKKWPAGANVKTYKERIRIPVGRETPAKGSTPATSTNLGGNGDAAMAAMKKGSGAAPSGYDLEKTIEIDFDKQLNQKDTEAELRMLKQKTDEQLQAERMAAMAARNRQDRMKYIYKTVERTFDDNPSYSSSMRMATPANPAHFLRVFGQPARARLGDFREDTPSMRQQLMILNGKLTHEASRVGPLEPVHRLISGKGASVDRAIEFVYLEILTRKPSAVELAEGREIVSGDSKPKEGLADLRWALLNSHEFRFLP